MIFADYLIIKLIKFDFKTFEILFFLTVFPSKKKNLLGKELAPGQNITRDECGCLHGACMFTEDRIRQCQCDPGYGGGTHILVRLFPHFCYQKRLDRLLVNESAIFVSFKRLTGDELTSLFTLVSTFSRRWLLGNFSFSHIFSYQRSFQRYLKPYACSKNSPDF